MKTWNPRKTWVGVVHSNMADSGGENVEEVRLDLREKLSIKEQYFSDTLMLF